MMKTLQKIDSTVFVFDLDGVITDVKTSEVDIKVVEKIYEFLNTDIPVAINTGRSYEWTEANLVNYLLEHHKQDNLFDNFIIVCEKAGETAQWQNGQFALKPSQFAIDDEVYKAAKTLFESAKDQFSTMFWDTTKKTMATIEKQPSADLTLFHEQQIVLVELLKTGLSSANIRIDPTTIATDVESTQAGKYAGAELIYEWSQSNLGIIPTSFVSIGDSSSDYEMARLFAEKDVESSFVYVGSKSSEFHNEDRVSLVLTKSKFADGTLEYLNSFSQV